MYNLDSWNLKTIITASFARFFCTTASLKLIVLPPVVFCCWLIVYVLNALKEAAVAEQIFSLLSNWTKFSGFELQHLRTLCQKSIIYFAYKKYLCYIKIYFRAVIFVDLATVLIVLEGFSVVPDISAHLIIHYICCTKQTMPNSTLSDFAGNPAQKRRDSCKARRPIQAAGRCTKRYNSNLHPGVCVILVNQGTTAVSLMELIQIYFIKI